MPLERRIPLILALTILLPSLAMHYGQFAAESRARVDQEAARGVALARVLAVRAAAPGGADGATLARAGAADGFVAVALPPPGGAGSPAPPAPPPTDRLVRGDPAAGATRPLTRLDTALLRHLGGDVYQELWVPLPEGAAGGAGGTLYAVRALAGQRPATRDAPLRQVAFTLALCLAAVAVLRLALVRWVERPLDRIAAAAARLAAGARGAPVPARGADAVGRLGRAFNAMADALTDAEDAAARDPLTGLLNHGAFHRALEAAAARAAADDAPLALVLLDLDGFKALNDGWGHPAGDAWLRAVAEALRATCRRGDLAGRVGGDEFALALPGTDAAGAADVVARLRAALPARLSGDAGAGGAAPPGCSAGVAVYPGDGAAVAAVVADADAALYRAKGRGGSGR